MLETKAIAAFLDYPALGRLLQISKKQTNRRYCFEGFISVTGNDKTRCNFF